MTDPAQHDSTRPGHAMRDLPRWHPNPFVRSTVDAIRKRGWQVTAVGKNCTRTSPECTAPECPFAYTSGLTLAGIPELAIYGHRQMKATLILNEVAHLLQRHDWQQIVDRRVPLTLETLSAPVRLIHALDKDDMLMANLLFPDTPALQVIWADDHHRLPWESGYDLLPKHQPLKGFPDLLPDRAPMSPRVITPDASVEAWTVDDS